MFVYDVDDFVGTSNDLRGNPVRGNANIKIFNNASSLPIEVGITVPPAADVRFDLVTDTWCCVSANAETPNLETKVTYSKPQLTFTPWVALDTFNFTVTDWDTGKGDTFQIDFTVSGLNADSYYADNTHSFTVTILGSDYSKPAVLTLDSTLATPQQYGYLGATATGSDQGWIHQLTLPCEQVGPTTGEALAGWLGPDSGSPDAETTARMLQDSNETETFDNTESDWEKE